VIGVFTLEFEAELGPRGLNFKGIFEPILVARII